MALREGIGLHEFPCWAFCTTWVLTSCHKSRIKPLKWREVWFYSHQCPMGLIVHLPWKESNSLLATYVLKYLKFKDCWARLPGFSTYIFPREIATFFSSLNTKKDWEAQGFQIKTWKIISLQMSKYFMNYMNSALARCVFHIAIKQQKDCSYILRDQSLLSTLSSSSI